jgi:hypothetical protein
MSQPLFDLDLKRVSREHYITGKAAINFPAAGGNGSSCRTLIESQALPRSRWQVSITRIPQVFLVQRGSSMALTCSLGTDGLQKSGLCSWQITTEPQRT